jgi:hypothetical protein
MAVVVMATIAILAVVPVPRIRAVDTTLIIAVAVVLMVDVAILTAIVVLAGRLAGVGVIYAAGIVPMAIVVMRVAAACVVSPILIAAADTRVRLIDMVWIVAVAIVVICHRRLIRRRIT